VAPRMAKLGAATNGAGRSGRAARQGEAGEMGARGGAAGALAAVVAAGFLAVACGGSGGGAAAGNGSGGGGAPPTATSPNPQRAGAPTVDIHYCTPKPAANAADPCWKNAVATPLATVMAGSMPSGFSATFQAVWNTKDLFVLEQVKNPKGFNPANANTTDPWESDAMEVYLSSTNSSGTTMGQNETQIDIPLGAPSSVWVYTNQSAAGVQAYVKTVSGGYDVMMAIPWTDTGGAGTKPGIGQVIGIDPATDTYSNGSSQNQAIAWGNPGSSEQNPSIWGQLVLQK
jgi:hypothetical protein